MPYDKLKRNKIDRCNICLETKPLSWDHVPPKSGIVLSSVEIKNIFKLLAGRQEDNFNISQNGVKYRTICSHCNSKIGSEYDPILNDLNENVSQFLKSNFAVPRIQYFKTKPLRLIKAILSHLLSVKTIIDEVTFDKDIRKFIFSETEIIPNNINIFYWIYPYDTTIIMRDFLIPAIPGDFSSFTFSHLIKYFPLAFLITEKEEFRGLPNLTKHRNCSIDDDIDIRIDFKVINDYDWPERVDNSNILVASAETGKGIRAKPRY